jgi:ribosomal protein L40E
MDEPGQDSEVVDAAAAAPLLDAVWGPDAELRNAALPALVRLPLSESTWQAIRGYAHDTLSNHADRQRDDVLAVIEASPWIRSADTRRLAERVALEAFWDDEDVHALVLRCLDQLRRSADTQPTLSTPNAGFVVYSNTDRELLRAGLSVLTDDVLWSLLDARYSDDGDRTREALVVARLMESAGRRADVLSRYRVMQWVADRGPRFQPDLDGLVADFLCHFERLPEVREELMARQVAWIISRGGLTALLDQLRPRLEASNDPARRLAAFQLVRYSAASVHESSPPADLTGLSYMDQHRTPSSSTPPDVIQIDDDVQFTLYRPSRVRPEVWYSMLAFAHRTEPTTDSSGQILDPIEEVEQRAERLLATSPGSFDVLRADSASGLRRGTDLCFQPWIEVGEINPSQQSLRWEEAVHHVEFRVRVPSSADGRRLQGGLRVFAGAILLAEIAFRLPVSSDSTVGPSTNERETARRFRQIFASYSHRDAAVVDAVEQYVSVTGDRYLMDSRTLRSGEVWDDRLRQLIEEADIFQLFWSRNSMNSKFVEQEWEYALQLGREGFVRPVYWEDPLAEDPDRDLPPERLRCLHFSWLGTPPPSDTALGAPAESQTRPRPPVRQAASLIVCTGCGHANPRDAGFCMICGAFLMWPVEKVQPGPLEEPPPPAAASTGHHHPTAVKPRPQAAKGPSSSSIRAGDLICHRCGEGNPPERKFCRRCGTSLESAERARPRRWTLKQIAWAVTVAVVAIVGAAWWLVR